MPTVTHHIMGAGREERRAFETARFLLGGGRRDHAAAAAGRPGGHAAVVQTSGGLARPLMVRGQA